MLVGLLGAVMPPALGESPASARLFFYSKGGRSWVPCRRCHSQARYPRMSRAGNRWRECGARRSNAQCMQTTPSLAPPRKREQALLFPIFFCAPALDHKSHADRRVPLFFFFPPVCLPLSSPSPRLAHTPGVRFPHPGTPTTAHLTLRLAAPSPWLPRPPIPRATLDAPRLAPPKSPTMDLSCQAGGKGGRGCLALAGGRGRTMRGNQKAREALSASSSGTVGAHANGLEA